MAPEQWEDDLRKEADALMTLQSLFSVFSDVLGDTLLRSGDELDDGLLLILNVIHEEAYNVLHGTVQYKKRVIHGIEVNLEDVLDEIQILQAGLATKKGVTDEDLEEDDEGGDEEDPS